MVEPRVGAAVPRRLGGEGVPLEHALRIREAAVVLGDLGRGEEEDLGLVIPDLDFAALHFRPEIPMRRRLGEPVVFDD